MDAQDGQDWIDTLRYSGPWSNRGAAAPDGGKTTERRQSSYGYGIVSKGGLDFPHPTYTIPFILCIHAKRSPSAKWVRVRPVAQPPTRPMPNSKNRPQIPPPTRQNHHYRPQNLARRPHSVPMNHPAILLK